MTTNRSTNKVLVFIVILLLITNISVVAYFLCFTKKPQPKNNRQYRDGFVSMLQKDVGFSDEQVAQFNELKKTYWQDAKVKMDRIIIIKNSIFDLTKHPSTPDSVVEKLADSIGILQKQVEIDAYKHVSETRKICTPAQQIAYDSLMRRFINKGRNKKTTDSLRSVHQHK